MGTKILVVDDKQIMRDSVGTTLQRGGYKVVVASDGETAMRMVDEHHPAMVVSDLKMPGMGGIQLLEHLKQKDKHLPVLLMTAFGTIETAVEAMRLGAYDFIQKPFDAEQLVQLVRSGVEHRNLVKENEALGDELREESGPMLVGKSKVMREMIQQITRIASSRGTVLINGESGTGKEVVARTLHAHSARRRRVMLCLNCAALSSSLLESELFGHEKGAFTGADQLRKGRFELADGGTLLLDEVSEIDPSLQAKLLRVLQEQQFERVGSSLSMRVDVRVIATTNRDLVNFVDDGDFRQDLYYRLNVLPISLPPLRERHEDIPVLVGHFLNEVGEREGRDAKRFDDGGMNALLEYGWPGNVRELYNICERGSVLSRGGVITADLITPWLNVKQPGGVVVEAEKELYKGPRPLDEIERGEIVKALDHFGGNRQRTAAALGIGVRTLGLKLKKWKEDNLIGQGV